MPIGFVISTPEEEVAQAVLKTSQEPFPRQDGNLFQFRPTDLPRFIAAVLTFAKGCESGSEVHRAAMRLVERLGTWIGQQIVAEKPQVDLFKSPEPSRKTLLRFLRRDHT